MVHCHVRIYLNFVTFPLTVVNKIVQVLKNIFFKTGFVINNKATFKKQLCMIRICCSWDLCRSTFPLTEEYIWITFFLTRCLLSSFFCKCLSKRCCLIKVIFPVIAVKILHYIQHAFSFRVQPVRTMTVTTIELLYYEDCLAMWRYQYVLRDLIEV